MLRYFRRAKKKIVEIPHDPPPGYYQGVWEKKRQPSPGAQAFAWETLGLAQFTPIGPTVNVRKPFNVTPGTMQPAVGLAVTMNGVPTVAGQIFGQGLYDQSAGGSGYTTGPGMLVNEPFPFSSEPSGGKTL